MELIPNDFAEYSQALAFDQLRTLMATGQAFVGFKEARIDFPPTFKYDVLRTLKKKKGSKRQTWKHFTANHFIRDFEEKEQQEFEVDGVEELDGDAASISSAWTSNSRLVEDQDYCQATPSSQSLNTPESRVSFAVVANKAKAKWHDLLSPTSPHRGCEPRQDLGHPRKLNGSLRLAPSGSCNSQPGPGSTPNVEHRSILRPLLSARASSTKFDCKTSDEDEGEDTGVYDSSHKQRVPSW